MCSDLELSAFSLPALKYAESPADTESFLFLSLGWNGFEMRHLDFFSFSFSFSGAATLVEGIADTVGSMGGTAGAGVSCCENLFPD